MRRSLLIIALTGCVSASTNVVHSNSIAPTNESITIHPYANGNALSAISATRPRWLENDPRIMIDGSETSRMMLETLRATNIKEVRYIHAANNNRAILNIVTW